MQLGSHLSLPPFLERAAEVGQRSAVRIQAYSIGSKYGHQWRREVEHLAQLRFRKPAFGDIHDRTNNLGAAGFTLRRPSHDVQIFGPPVWHQQTKLQVNSFS